MVVKQFLLVMGVVILVIWVSSVITLHLTYGVDQ